MNQYSPDGRWFWNGQAWEPARSAPGSPIADPRQPTTQRMVREYKNEKAYGKDARKLALEGWVPVATIGGGDRITATRLLTTGVLALAWKKGRPITVTWERTS